jgi:hypothetical protein
MVEMVHHLGVLPAAVQMALMAIIFTSLVLLFRDPNS